MEKESLKVRLTRLETQRVNLDVSDYGPLFYNKGLIVDETSGMALGPRGFLDTGDGTMGFRDPRRGGRMPNGQEFFYFPFIFLRAPSSPAGKGLLGYRIERSDLRRVQYAETFIVAALKARMRAYDELRDPIVELV